MVENQVPISLAQMEALERTQRLTLDDYARMMLTMLLEKAPMDARDLWKRTPDDLKGNILLTSLNGVADSLTEKAFTKVHAHWRNIAFPAALNDLALDVSRRLHFFGLEHVRRVYNVISLDRFATLTGLKNDIPAAIAFAVDAGLEYDPTTNYITVIPMLPDESLDDEGWDADLDSLGAIRETVWALSRPANPTPDNLLKKTHDY